MVLRSYRSARAKINGSRTYGVIYIYAMTDSTTYAHVLVPRYYLRFGVRDRQTHYIHSKCHLAFGNPGAGPMSTWLHGFGSDLDRKLSQSGKGFYDQCCHEEEARRGTGGPSVARLYGLVGCGSTPG